VSRFIISPRIQRPAIMPVIKVAVAGNRYADRTWSEQRKKVLPPAS